ncbi:hypothetical protein RBB83_12925 [Paenibacillus peoriae]|uniref:hypothetical protein n=1 Tax=Paenibacillus peoriae TaxID=59893 RepID=UPI0030D1C1DD
MSGIFIQSFTTRKLFLSAFFLSLTGALIGAIAGSFTILLIGSVLQDLGTDLIIPLMKLHSPSKKGHGDGACNHGIHCRSCGWCASEACEDKMSHIAQISFNFKYDSAVSETDIVTEYWDFFLKWV